MKKRLAIVGTGISGLACGYFLQQEFDIQLFEKNSHVGGHSLTIDVVDNSVKIPIDMGFMVFNRQTYPNLFRLFQELNVPIKNADMSFSVQHFPLGIEYCGSSLNQLFAQRKNLIRPKFWRMLLQINRFNKEAVATLQSGEFDSFTLAEYVKEKKYGDDFLNLYIIPMSAAIWSIPSEVAMEFPVISLLQFFYNHGFLGMSTQHQWLTPDGCSRNYVEKITASFKNHIRLGESVTGIVRTNGKATIITQNGTKEVFDKVILASHADQSLRVLDHPSALEETLLGKFKYQKNIGTLHTDSRQMPKRKLCWSSWNCLIKGDYSSNGYPQTLYWINSIQNFSAKDNYFVTINGVKDINEKKIIKQVEFEHPIFSRSSIDVQKDLHILNQSSGDQTVYFCGSYFKYGFHEDGLNSALDLCSRILRRPLWN